MNIKEAKKILTDMYLYGVLKPEEEEAIETALNELDRLRKIEVYVCETCVATSKSHITYEDAISEIREYLVKAK